MHTSKLRDITAALVAASLCTFLTSVRAEGAQTFEVRYTRIPKTVTELVSLPTVGIAPLNLAAISPELAAELSEAVSTELELQGEKEQFAVLTQLNADLMRWALVARAQHRQANATLNAEFSANLLACLHSLDKDGVPLATLNLLLSGAPLQGNAERIALDQGAQQMLDHWKHDRCAVPRNALSLLDANRERIVAASLGMLTGEFDALQFSGQALLDLIRGLDPLFFAQDGVWHATSSKRLQQSFGAALENSFIGEEWSSAALMCRAASFEDWSFQMLEYQPGVVSSFIETVAEVCLPDQRARNEPFVLQTCLQAGSAELVSLKFQGRTYVAVQKGRR